MYFQSLGRSLTPRLSSSSAIANSWTTWTALRCFEIFVFPLRPPAGIHSTLPSDWSEDFGSIINAAQLASFVWLLSDNAQYISFLSFSAIRACEIFEISRRKSCGISNFFIFLKVYSSPVPNAHCSDNTESVTRQIPNHSLSNPILKQLKDWHLNPVSARILAAKKWLYAFKRRHFTYLLLKLKPSINFL